MDIDAPVDFKENSEAGAFFPTEYLPPGFFTSTQVGTLFAEFPARVLDPHAIVEVQATVKFDISYLTK
ncbi:MAG: hypothetical protein EZS28_043881, partial [Streblomastix strix]